MTKLEDLLDAADALTKDQDCPPRPDFPLPDDTVAKTVELLERKSTENKGMGLFAKQDIPAGTLLMVSKPLAMVMNYEEDGNDNDEDDDAIEEEGAAAPSKMNFLLVLELLKLMVQNPEVWTKALCELFPRNEAEVSRLPPMECHDDKLKQQLQQQFEELKRHPALGKMANEIAQRLILIVRYNNLSVETGPELLSHPTSHAALGGAGVYYEPSFFNHNSRPNVSRWAIGDVMFFVANQSIPAGTETCISYIEHDVLCESTYRRNNVLQMDFQDGDVAAGDPPASEADGPEMPVVDDEVQNELMATNPFDRLNDIDQLMLQAQGKAPPHDQDEEMDVDEEDMDNQGPWFQIDMQSLRILKAITLDNLGQSSQALPLWEECVVFSETQMPPMDENSVVMRVQAALCAWHVNEKQRAQEHAQKALFTHDKLFGGGLRRFRRRYQRDFDLLLRKTTKGGVDTLWPLTN